MRKPQLMGPPLAQSRAYFDLEGDGRAQHTGLVKADDGFLAIDRDGNGVIDDGRELFGNTNGFGEGFRSLSTYDSNLDYVMDAGDQIFNQLVIWRDLDGDGRTQDGELFNAAELGLTRISLAYTPTDYLLAGNRVSGVVMAEWAGNTQRKVVDAWFAFSTVNTLRAASAAPAMEVSEAEWNALAALPDLRGWGNLKPLREAMLADATLKSLVQAFVDLGPSAAMTTYRAQTEAIMYRWAGTTAVSTSSRGGYIDGRKLETLEEFWGFEWRQMGTQANPTNGGSALVINDSWAALVDHLAHRLLYLGPRAAGSPYASHDFVSDTMVLADAAATATSLKAAAPADPAQAAAYWTGVLTLAHDAAEQRGGVGKWVAMKLALEATRAASNENFPHNTAEAA